ncbi:hypothetical protein QTP70_009150 [Hemibagrus guttatus]|uniref:Reverse transcriptase domain-containing protein n=1 Tax=Hemibagrus guttatus TaxID=175788 RepID=A0AAE0PZ75_9TELE|nr:hypothetical protein QTP70_009150 [Hemibagrus guttatus]
MTDQDRHYVSHAVDESVITIDTAGWSLKTQSFLNPPESGVMGGLIPGTTVPAPLQQVLEAASVEEADPGFAIVEAEGLSWARGASADVRYGFDLVTSMGLFCGNGGEEALQVLLPAALKSEILTQLHYEHGHQDVVHTAELIRVQRDSPKVALVEGLAEPPVVSSQEEEEEEVDLAGVISVGGKLGNIGSFNDYRPFALTSVVMKSFERLVLSYLKHITDPLLDPLQFAYRANRSVDNAVNMALHFILQHLDSPGSYASILFVDFSSDFNTIVPALLRDKLFQLNVPDSMCSWITDFLTDRR